MNCCKERGFLVPAVAILTLTLTHAAAPKRHGNAVSIRNIC